MSVIPATSHTCHCYICAVIAVSYCCSMSGRSFGVVYIMYFLLFIMKLPLLPSRSCEVISVKWAIILIVGLIVSCYIKSQYT